MMTLPRTFHFSRNNNTNNTNKDKNNSQSNKTDRRPSPPKQDNIAEDPRVTESNTSLSNVSMPRPANREMSTTTTMTKSPVYSEPLVIPVRGRRDNFHTIRRPEETREPRNHGRRQHMERRQPTHASLSPSMANLLATTSIPRPKSASRPRRVSGNGQRLTVDAVLKHTRVSEKEFNLSMGRSQLDYLLSPPEDLEEDETLDDSDACGQSVLSSRAMSVESMPSLSDSIDASPSLASIMTPSPRGRRMPPTRRLESVKSEGGSPEDPLSMSDTEIDQMDFRVFDDLSSEKVSITSTAAGAMSRKSAFKSNLTASLRAIRSAARSLSNLAPPPITPDDFLTRSILTIDPQVPFTDERMPPRLEDTPTAALRRYLNPTTNAPIEAHIPTFPTQSDHTGQCTASIQMQTYKFSRSAKSTSPNVISKRTQTSTEEVFNVGPLARQRDKRENSDWLRMIVLEMAMRRAGKLAEDRPGKAKWALAARVPSTSNYEIKEGVPVRWIAQTFE